MVKKGKTIGYSDCFVTLKWHLNLKGRSNNDQSHLLHS